MATFRRALWPAAGILSAAALAWGPLPLCAQDGTPKLTTEQKEEFLRTAKIIADNPANKGVTDTRRVTLTDGKITHDANVQRIDEHRDYFEGQNGTREFNFKDTYKFNLAAWELAKLLAIEDMMPPYVERRYAGNPASFSWYVDNELMDDEERIAKHLHAPDQAAWREESYVVSVFDQLIYNTDRNEGNLLIDQQWGLWMIDHTRAFRTRRDLLDPKGLVKCDRNLLARMKALDADTIHRVLGPYLNKEEVKGLLARRDKIVKFFEDKGESALYDRPKRS